MTRRGALLWGLLLPLAACAPAREPVGRPEVIRRILPCTIQLRAERESGVRRAASGVVVASTTEPARVWILTTRHFVDPPATQQILARRPGRHESLPVRIAARSPVFDLALLVADGVAIEPTLLKDTSALGDDVLVVGFPWGGRLTVVSGIVSQLAAPSDGGLLVTGPARLIDASVSYGSSGGGVFDRATGALIGVVESYRTAKLVASDGTSRPLEVPVAGETTIIAAADIARFLLTAGVESQRSP